METAGGAQLGWSAFTLTTINLVTIPVALVLNWPVGEIIGIYFFQSLIVKCFAVVRAVGIMRSPQPALGPPVDRADYSHVFGCVVFFAIFHLLLGFAAFALGFVADTAAVVLILAFLLHSAYDYRLDLRRDAEEGLPDPMKVLHLALARTLPLMLMVMVATNFQHALVYMLAIKAIADSALHAAGCGDTRSGPPSPDFTLAGVEVYLPFNLTVGLTIVSVLVVAGLCLRFF